MPEPKPFRAIHAYEPQIDDELRLEVDNEIDVLYEYDDGWCWAINKTTNEQGACPLLCLVSAKEASKSELMVTILPSINRNLMTSVALTCSSLANS